MLCGYKTESNEFNLPWHSSKKDKLLFFKGTRLGSSVSIVRGRPRIWGLISAIDKVNVIHILILSQFKTNAPSSKLNFTCSMKFKLFLITSLFPDCNYGNCTLILTTNWYINKHIYIYLLKEAASVIRERDIQADRPSRSSCQLGHAGYVAESLVRARLLHRCLPSNKRAAHWVCVISHETVTIYATVATNFVTIFQ
jgi:hypothetical protein